MIIHYKKVDKEFFRKRTELLIEKNFDTISPYFISSSYIFKELVEKIHEVYTCLIFECYSASISLINHILERLLKVALIYNETGVGQVGLKDINNHFGPAHKKHQGEDLYKTINLCCSAGLISKVHKKYLNDEVREKLRNGFSHSDPNKILVDEIFNWKNPNETGDIKLDPLIQSQLMYKIAAEEAVPYFQNVLEIMVHIEEVLREKDRQKRDNNPSL